MAKKRKSTPRKKLGRTKKAASDLPEPTEDMNPDWFVKTCREICVFFGLSDNYVRKADWYRSAKKYSAGWYLPDLVKGRYEQAMKAPQLGGPTAASFASSPLTEKKSALADEDLRRKRIENDLREKNLVHIDRVRRQIVEWAIRFRTPLLALGRQVSNRVPGNMKASVKKEVDAQVRASLDQVLNFKFQKMNADDMILKEAELIRKKRSSGRGRPRKKKTA